MAGRASKIAPLLFGSGACALVYQVAWFREFRLIFGASTTATGAVLALFAGGLGIGGLVLGPRADRHPNPMRLYAMLELGVAASAAVTPVLLWLVRWVYIAVGGTPTLGLIAGTLARLLLAALVLGVPTFLMGGTLPAAARAVATDDDLGRRRIGWLYGVNTLGAVAGCLAATFWLFEVIGTRRTLLVAVAVNIVVSLGAFCCTWRGARRPSDDRLPRERRASARESRRRRALTVRRFVVAAAGIVGFASSSWRSSGTACSVRSSAEPSSRSVSFWRWRSSASGSAELRTGLCEKIAAPSLEAFSSTALLEALVHRHSVRARRSHRDVCPRTALARDARLRRARRRLGCSLPCWWCCRPRASRALQFPMLIALLGRGRSARRSRNRSRLRRQHRGGHRRIAARGLRVASLARSARDVGARWRRCSPCSVSPRPAGSPARTGISRGSSSPVGLASIVALCSARTDPTAVWRHSPIGVGRVPAEAMASRNAWRNWTNAERRSVRWETDGVESSVALEPTRRASRSSSTARWTATFAATRRPR